MVKRAGDANHSNSDTAEALLRCYTPGCVRGAALTASLPADRQIVLVQRASTQRQSSASDAAGWVAAEQRLRCGQGIFFFQPS